MFTQLRMFHIHTLEMLHINTVEMFHIHRSGRTGFRSDLDQNRTFSRWSREGSREVLGQWKGLPARFPGCFEQLFSDIFQSCSLTSPGIFPALPDGFWALLEKLGRGGSGVGGSFFLPNEDSYINSRSTARQAAASNMDIPCSAILYHFYVPHRQDKSE